jgi:PAS domain S-box-containing protein
LSRSARILIVDDDHGSRQTLDALLSYQPYELSFAASGPEALMIAHESVPDLILLDVMMPGMDGYDVCRRLREDPQLADVPIVMISALDDRDSRLEGITAGADDFITKPFDSLELEARIRTITSLNRYRRLLAERSRFDQLIDLAPDGFLLIHTDGRISRTNAAMLSLLGVTSDAELVGSPIESILAPSQRAQVQTCLADVISGRVRQARIETQFTVTNAPPFPAEICVARAMWDDQPVAQVSVRDVTERVRAARALQLAHDELARSYDATLEGWVRALDLRDRATEGHTQRVTSLTIELARIMGYKERDLVHIRRGALLHDIGKIGIPDAILHKAGPLNDEEWALMRQHPVYAYEMLAPIAFLRPALDIPYCHHEKWDGTGYPRRLHGDQIPLSARIFAVVDVWDALRSVRPYHAAWPIDKAREYIRSQAGSHFDPQVVSVFMDLTRDGR